VLATFYCLGWDYYMDWGLLRSRKQGHYLLRDVTQFPAGFYYFAMVVNFLLRFFWVIGFLQKSTPGEYSFIKEYQILAFSSMMAEAIRRTIWACIRIENEFHNNFENYRVVLVIPALIDKSN
jgi:hypothetical protein